MVNDRIAVLAARDCRRMRLTLPVTRRIEIGFHSFAEVAFFYDKR